MLRLYPKFVRSGVQVDSTETPGLGPSDAGLLRVERNYFQASSEHNMR